MKNVVLFTVVSLFLLSACNIKEVEQSLNAEQVEEVVEVLDLVDDVNLVKENYNKVADTMKNTKLVENASLEITDEGILGILTVSKEMQEEALSNVRGQFYRALSEIDKEMKVEIQVVQGGRIIEEK